jgi:serine/threonine protein kinase
VPLAVLGYGEFGVVRLVRRRSDGAVFALKAVAKARLKGRDAEFLLRERMVLEEVGDGCAFCVGFHGAYQSDKLLYLLMVRMGVFFRGFEGLEGFQGLEG